MISSIPSRITCGLLACCLSMPLLARDYVYSDAHLHYVDFFQETEGMQALLDKMDESGVEHVMLSGIPVAKKWSENEPKRPRYYAGDDGSAYWFSAIRFCQVSIQTIKTPTPTFGVCWRFIRGSGRALVKSSPDTMI